MRPICVDLFCGLGGWSDGFLDEEYQCWGFDIERHDYGSGGYRGDLVLQDIMTLHGSQFKAAAVIVASPPCQKYSYLAMPWSRSPNPNNSLKAKALRKKWETEGPDNRLFDACFRIQREACEAAERHIPMIVENVRGAIPWVGQSKWAFGSFHLWGDVPALMPISRQRKVKIRSWSDFGQPDYKAEGFNVQAAKEYREFTKNSGGSWFAVDSNSNPSVRNDPRYGNNPVSIPADGVKCGGPAGNDWFAKHNRPEFFAGSDQKIIFRTSDSEAIKIGGDWFSDSEPPSRKWSSRSNSRKAASATIAKIPYPLSRYLARVFKPEVGE